MKGWKFLSVVMALFLALTLTALPGAAAEEEHEHQWVELSRTEATCEKMGEIHLRCWICYAEHTGVIQPLGHDFVSEADFFDYVFGYVYRKCWRCEKTIRFTLEEYEKQKSEPKPEPEPPFEPVEYEHLTDHQKQLLSFPIGEELEEFYKYYYSMPDGPEIVGEHFDFDPEKPYYCEWNHYDHSGRGYIANGHLCPLYKSSASCTQWGYEMYLPCWKCGRTAWDMMTDSEKAEWAKEGRTSDFWFTDPPTGHNFTYACSYVNPAPTCTEDGVEWLPCANLCGEEISIPDPAYGHSYIPEKLYLDLDGDGTKETTTMRVFCEHGDDDRNATIVGSLWKEGTRVAIPYPTFAVTFTDSAGKKTEAEMLESSWHGYFAELPPGDYTMTVTAEGYAARTYKITITKGAVLEKDVYLNTTGDYPAEDDDGDGGEAAQAGWQQTGGKWWYRNADGSYPANKWQELDGAWYHFDGSGFMQTGWLRDGNSWYYLRGSGAMATGWVSDGVSWYYLGADGAMKTGWRQVDGTWYYLRPDGAMAANEWRGGYWLGASGAWTYAPTGSWHSDSAGWWFGDTSGWYAKNAWQRIDGAWYYFSADGYMHTGWLREGNTWYYLKPSGAMAAGETVGGYTFAADGVWIG